jgi:HK97 family phage prohead protease
MAHEVPDPVPGSWKDAMTHRPQLVLDAATARGQALRAPADRPQQRRSAQPRTSAPSVSARAKITVEPTADTLTFVGYASITGAGYEMWDAYGPYTEVVSPGAFAASLARTDLDVPLVLQHQDIRRIARTTLGTLTLAEDDQGLLVTAQLDPADPDVAYIVPKLRSGLVDEMSFRFHITAGSWSPDWTEYHIDAADIHRGDTAIVGYGANPATAGAGLRSQDPVKAPVYISETEIRARAL